MTTKQKKILKRIIISALLVICAFLIHNEITAKTILFISYIVIGYDILIKAVKGIVNRQIFDENLLMAIATVGAVLLGDFFEAVAVMLFYQTGELFQSIAVGKSRKSISALIDIIPQYANLVTDEGVKQVEPDEIEQGSEIIVKAGEKIPLDGIVIQGSTSLDTSAITGESVPREISVGENIVSGCINLTSVIRVKTTKLFEDSTASKILELVENSSMRKSKSEQFISRFAKVYTPLVCALAAFIGLGIPLFLIVAGQSPAWSSWITRALTFLVISCPCALVVSIPLSFFSGIGCASKNGILVKGSNYLESLSMVKHIVFDKTGTLTKGKFTVTQIKTANGVKEEDVLFYAAYCEHNSIHPIAQCIKNSYPDKIDLSKIKEVTELAGYGVKAKIDEKEVYVGNYKLLTDLGVELEDLKEEATSVYVAVDKTYLGCIILSDTPKENSKEAISLLKKKGIKNITLLTGDTNFSAKETGKELGIDNIISNLLPHQKVEELEKLMQRNKKGELLCYVGDGINDAPVLARADVGVSMGALGSDAAIEASDIVLMDDDPIKLITAVNISSKTVKIAEQNIVFALAVKIICLSLGAVGVAGMELAIFADVGVMVIAVLNSMRAMKIKRL